MPEAGEIQTITTRPSMTTKGENLAKGITTTKVENLAKGRTTTKVEILAKRRRVALNAVETILPKNAINPILAECVAKKDTSPRIVLGPRLIALLKRMARSKKFTFLKKWLMMTYSNREFLLELTSISSTKSRSSAVATMLLHPLPLLKAWAFDNC